MLHGITEQIDDYLVQPGGVSPDLHRSIRNVQDKGLGPCSKLSHGNRPSYQRNQILHLKPESELAALQASHVHEIAYHDSHPLPLPESGLSTVPKLPGEQVRQIAGEATENHAQGEDHGRKRRPQFMTHPRHKLILQAVETSLGDVADGHNSTARIPAVVPKRLTSGCEPASPPIRRGHGEFHTERRVTGCPLLRAWLRWG